MTTQSGYMSSQLRGEINITPMIDVLLVLLIIFMLIAPVMPHALHAALPHRSGNVSAVIEAPVLIQVLNRGDGLLTYKINKETIGLDELGSRLVAIFSVRPARVIFVKADESVNFSAVAKVMDIAKGAGADRIGLVKLND